MITVIKIIGACIAVAFIVVGIVTLVMAHGNEDGPLQSRGIMEIVTGLVILVILTSTTLLGSNFGLADWVVSPNIAD